MPENLVQQRRIAWSGPTAGGLGWLRTRIEQDHEVLDLPPTCEAAAKQMEGVERIIVASPDRLTIPSPAWQSFNVPLALATEAWWEGSGRTGLRHLDYPAIPWYRWWDTWHGWLAGTNQRLFSPFPTRLVHSQVSDVRIPLERSRRQSPATPAWIITYCCQTANAWTKTSELLGENARWMTPHQFFQHAASRAARATGQGGNSGAAEEQASEAPSWLLWDDAGGDIPQREMADSVGYNNCGEIFRTARELWPKTLLLASLTVPRWSVWREALDNGAQELIAKPHTATSLLSVLVDRELQMIEND